MIHLSILGRIALTTADGTAVRSVIAQPKRTALLAYLALRAGDGVTRDLLIETLWPELEPERGRAALRKGLHFLRQALGAEAIVTAGGQVTVSPSRLHSDVVEFERAVAAGDAERAVELYGGELLPGLVVSGAPDFDVWVDGQRSRLRRLASEAAAAAFHAAASAGARDAAWRHLESALAIDPVDDAAVQRLLQFAAQAREPERGLRLYEQHRAFIAAEWDVEPSPESRQLAAQLAELRSAPVLLEAPTKEAEAVETAAGTEPVVIRTRTWSAVAVVAVLVTLLIPLRSRLVDVDGDAVSDSDAAMDGGAASSHIARRFYQEGRRLYMQGSAANARPLFAAALEEDSTFALAAYYLAVSAPDFDRKMLERAARLSESRPERERLVIRTGWLQYMDDPGRLAAAESLAVRYPQDPEGHIALGRAQFWGGDFDGALRTLLRVVAADSASTPTQGETCRACQAWLDLSSLYLHVDSGAAAERVARAYLTRYPDSDRGWDMLINALEHQGRYAEMWPALARFAALTGDEDDAYIRRAGAAIRQGHFAMADSLLTRREPLRIDTRALQFWYRMISLRNQRRLDEALALAGEYDRLQSRRGDPDSDIGRVLRAIVLHEAGEHASAAALFERVAARPPDDAPSRRARHIAWNLVHAATARAALGDTARLRVIADSVERAGRLSAYGRDRRLHHHVRGLDAALRGDTAAAIRHLRAAVFSLTHGYTRTNLELGRLLNATGRHADAVRILEPALRGTLSSSQLYATHTALHEQLLIARRALGHSAHAREHEAWLTRAGGE